jgi:hypothetical protein
MIVNAGRERVFNTPLTEQVTRLIHVPRSDAHQLRELLGLGLVWPLWAIKPLQRYNSLITFFQRLTR